MTKMTRRTAVTLLGATALATPFVRPANAATGTLNLYNWADYIGETTIADFEAASGLKVNSDYFSSVEEMQAKILAGSTGYDVVLQSGPNLPVMLQAGVYQPLDKAQLSSWKNLDESVLKILAQWDPDNRHALPYMWGSVGMTYNMDMIRKVLPDADLNSLSAILDPANAKALARCGLALLDSPSDVLTVVMRYLGIDPDTATAADFDAAVKAMAPMRRSVRTFSNTAELQGLPSGELCAANTWSGSYGLVVSKAKEAGLSTDFAYFVPETGAPIWIDCFCVPTDAPHPEAASVFLEYMLQPKVIAACTNYLSYANANAAATPLVDPAISGNPALYPDAETMKRLYAPKAWNNTQLQEMTAAWNRIKTAG
ncbi:extracellular solute-binding protein [Pseudooceanicola sp. CBS1P-1]|uniref:Putrescine-binding periplasmic protein n=1 Tax=Pseudooceanicola albus TaxID=2692189 RepID=A0A6L7GAF2_9RHOB|nr:MULTISPECIES: extracellular solute-binding protein [Pseudooceanicola]MBT9386853.1 extracellular solute-binding protein [Pseudooceanicola endophyticus]MXN21011.1 extracellular solute-binding protein [Pseudooceanicola albus]